MMIPKLARLKDPAAIKAATKPYSELSGKRAYGGPHHVITVGAGGPDHTYNLIQLTTEEHTKAHTGEIKRDLLLEIIAEREGVTVEQIKSALLKIMRGVTE